MFGMFGNKEEKAKKKAQKKAVAAVVKKYINTSIDAKSLKRGLIWGAIGMTALAADIMFTAGTSTATYIILGGAGPAMAGLKAWGLGKPVKGVNTAQQIFQTPALVAQTLVEMERRLQLAFNRSAGSILTAEKETFEKTAAEIDQDLQTLSPAINITASGPQGFGTEKYEMIVTSVNPMPGHVKLITLNDILSDMAATAAKKQAEEKAQQDAIKQLQDRVDELENKPGITKLPKPKH